MIPEVAPDTGAKVGAAEVSAIGDGLDFFGGVIRGGKDMVLALFSDSVDGVVVTVRRCFGCVGLPVDNFHETEIVRDDTKLWFGEQGVNTPLRASLRGSWAPLLESPR